MKREAAIHKWIHSLSSTVGGCYGVYKHAECPLILVNAAYCRVTALSVEVACLEKVTPFHFSVLIVPGTMS